MKLIIWICMVLLPSSWSGFVDWSKMRPVFQELPNYFIGDLKYKIVHLKKEYLKLKGKERQKFIHNMFTKSDIEEIQRNLMLWSDYARAELGTGGSPSEKKLLQRLAKIFNDEEN